MIILIFGSFVFIKIQVPGTTFCWLFPLIKKVDVFVERTEILSLFGIGKFFPVTISLRSPQLPL